MKNQTLQEVQEVLNANYNDLHSAFEFFLSHEQKTRTQAKDVSYPGFQKAIESLIPKRFDVNDIIALWKACSGGSGNLTFDKFQQLFDNNRFTGSHYISPEK